MPAIHPFTALKSQRRELKTIADTGISYITENGRRKCASMSEGVLQQRIDDVVEDALHEQRMGEALRQSRQDFEEGRYCSSREDLVDAVRKKRAARA